MAPVSVRLWSMTAKNYKTSNKFTSKQFYGRHSGCQWSGLSEYVPQILKAYGLWELTDVYQCVFYWAMRQMGRCWRRNWVECKAMIPILIFAWDSVSNSDWVEKWLPLAVYTTEGDDRYENMDVHAWDVCAWMIPRVVEQQNSWSMRIMPNKNQTRGLL